MVVAGQRERTEKSLNQLHIVYPDFLPGDIRVTFQIFIKRVTSTVSCFEYLTVQGIRIYVDQEIFSRVDLLYTPAKKSKHISEMSFSTCGHCEETRHSEYMRDVIFCSRQMRIWQMLIECFD